MADEAQGALLRQQMIDAGAPPTQVEAYMTGLRTQMLQAGAPPAEVDAYFGNVKPDFTQLEHSMAGLVEGTPPKEATDPLAQLNAGLQMSVSGLAIRRSMPDTVLAENAGLMEHILFGTGQMIGDMPASIAGLVGGASAGGAAGSAVPVVGTTVGAIVGAGAGSTALPTMLRETMINMYEGTGPFTWDGFYTGATEVAWKTAKSAVVGAVAAPLGAVASKVVEPVAGPFIAGAANATTFAGAATVTGAALEGQLPSSEDFVAGAILALGFHTAGQIVGAGKRFVPNQAGEDVAANLRDIYHRTGLTPKEAVEKAQTDVVFRAEILAKRSANGTRVSPELDIMARDLGRQDQGEAPMKVEPAPKPKEGEEPVPPKAPNLTPEDVPPVHLELFRALEQSADDAVSPAGAIGRYQIMPNTARQYGFDPARLQDPVYNETVARAILADLNNKFDGNMADMAVAYNAGPGRARAWIKGGRVFSSLPLETQRYLLHAEELGAVDLGARDAISTRVLEDQGETFADMPPDLISSGGGGGRKPPLEGDILRPDDPGGRKRIEGEEPFAKAGEDELRDTILEIVGPDGRRNEEDTLLNALNPVKLIRGFQSQLEPAAKIDKQLGIPKSEPGIEDMFRQTFGSVGRANLFWETGPVHLTDDGLGVPVWQSKKGASFRAAYKAVKEDGGDRAGFLAYRLAARTIEKARQGIETGVDPAAAKAYLEKPEVRAKYERGARVMQEAKDAAIDYLLASGVISEAMAEATKLANQEHIVMRRIMDEDYMPPRPGRSFGVRTPMKVMKGSKRQVVDPELADVDNLVLQIAMADRNVAMGYLLKKVEEFNATRPAPEQIPLVRVKDTETGKELKVELQDEMGNPIPNEVAAGLEPMIATKKLAKGRSPDDFIYFRDGKPEVWHSLDPDLSNVLRVVWTGKMDPVPNLLVKIAELQRAGITGELDFAFRSITYGQFSAAVFAEGGSKVPFSDLYRGILSGLGWKDAGAWDRFAASGGAGSALSDIRRNYIDTDIQVVFEKTNLVKRVWNAVTHPLDALRLFQHAANTAAQVGLMRRLEKTGKSSLKAAMLARRAYLDHAEGFTTNFVNAWARMVPFMGVGIKDFEQVLRAFKERPIGTIASGAVIVTLPTLLNYAANAWVDQFLPEKERYANLPQWQRDLFWILPPTADGIRVKVKRPPSFGSFIFGTMPERMLDYAMAEAVGKGADAVKELRETFFSMVQQSVPPVAPSLVQPIIEDWADKTLFGRPLMPQRLEDRTNWLQYTPDTTQTAKEIAKFFGPMGMNMADNLPRGITSPIVLENYVKGWLGPLPLTILGILEAPFKPMERPWEPSDIPWVSSFLVRNPGAGQALEDFYTELDSFTKAHADLKAAMESQDPVLMLRMSGNVKAFTSLYSTRKAISTMSALVNAIGRDKTLTNDEKLKNIDGLYDAMYAAAKAGLLVMRALPENGSQLTPTP